MIGMPRKAITSNVVNEYDQIALRTGLDIRTSDDLEAVSAMLYGNDFEEGTACFRNVTLRCCKYSGSVSSRKPYSLRICPNNNQNMLIRLLKLIHRSASGMSGGSFVAIEPNVDGVHLSFNKRVKSPIAEEFEDSDRARRYWETLSQYGSTLIGSSQHILADIRISYDLVHGRFWISASHIASGIMDAYRNACRFNTILANRRRQMIDDIVDNIEKERLDGESDGELLDRILS